MISWVFFLAGLALVVLVEVLSGGSYDPSLSRSLSYLAIAAFLLMTVIYDLRRKS